MRLFSMLKKNSKLALKNNWGSAILLLLIIFGVSMLLSVLQQVAISVFVSVPMLNEAITDYFKDPFNTMPDGMMLQMIAVEYIIIGVFSVLSIVFIAPLSLGEMRWFYRLVHGERKPVSEVFHFFESLRRFGRALWYNVNIYVRTLLWSFVFFIVPGGILGVSIYFLSEEQEMARSSSAIASTGIFLSVVLMLLAAVFYAACVNRYAIAPYLLAEDDEITVRKAIKESIKYTKGFRFSLFWFEMSYIGWFLLCMLALPLLLYVTPYYNTAFAMYARYIVEKNRYARPDWAAENVTREFVAANGEQQPLPAQTEQPAQFSPMQESAQPAPAQEPEPVQEQEQEPEPQNEPEKDGDTPE